MSTNQLPILPGKLGNPDLTLADDPRADPRLVAAMQAGGMAGDIPHAGIDGTSTVEEVLNYIQVAEDGSGAALAQTVQGLPEIDGVVRSVETIRGVDDNEIQLYVHRPSSPDGPVPGIVHLHGGGMVMLDAEGPLYARWRDELAAAGLVAVGVEFRNGGGKLGPHPFPAGLDDCSSAVSWVHAHRSELGISKLVVSGESGGGNLTLATTLKAKREGTLSEIDGVYAMCPYISGAYASKPPELVSLHENDGLFVRCDMMAGLAKAYDPSGENATNPLAWPYHAEYSDLENLPPHVISVNELDPLRDEGLAYFRKLMRAGVSATSRTVNGTCHAAENNFFIVIPDVCRTTIRDIAGFARSLT